MPQQHRAILVPAILWLRHSLERVWDVDGKRPITDAEGNRGSGLTGWSMGIRIGRASRGMVR